MRMICQTSAALLIALSVSFATAAPGDQSVFEDFEGFSPNTTAGDDIVIGSSPEKATLSGNAFAGVLGQGALYHSGVRSWMVMQDSVGRVDFDLNAAVVEFFARPHPNADGDTVISAFDDLGNSVGASVTLTPGDDWELISYSGSIDYLLIDNQATNIMNGIDDFGYTAIPEPSSLALVAGALSIAVAACRRRKGSLGVN